MKLAIIAVLIILCAVSIVSAENTYVPVEQPTVTQSGHLYIHVLCMHNLFSKDMTLTNLDNGQMITLELNPDGTFDTELIAGTYFLVLEDGNAGHSESRMFTIVNGETQHEWFIGHARSVDEVKTIITPTPTPIPTETLSPEPSPTITPEITPTITPTATPTPEPTPRCHKEKVCIPRYWTYDKEYIYKPFHDGEYMMSVAVHCEWKIVPHWHPEKCKTITVCV
jgi:hypothetical protein